MLGFLRLMWDPTYFLVIVGTILSLMASAYLQRTFQKYSQIDSEGGYTGTDVAKLILEAAHIKRVRVQPISGELTDNYDARRKVLSLSVPVADCTSVAALGVAAHECGHAVQDDRDYAPLRIRAMLVPVANIGSNLAFPVILIGLFLGQYAQPVINFGILLFSLALLFQLVTLPVEFDASRRALAILEQQAILTDDELRMAKKVLTAAALTYVAATVTVFLQLLRLILIFGDRRD